MSQLGSTSCRGGSMGVSYTEYGSLGFWARDETVELWLFLFVSVVDTLSAPAPWLQEAREDWYAQATAGFRGFVTAGLDRHLAGELDREREFLALLVQAHDHIASYGTLIPAEVTAQWHIGGGKVRWGDQRSYTHGQSAGSRWR